ncbi:glycosyltransferase family 2 protein [Streptomyces sp. NPDC004647]|uniref:glycosyltransferase family 2 protein n=1 Tax=Streptomyces sp. NPDC004647 TaxID=3154671 RepID=UPI0033AE166F
MTGTDTGTGHARDSRADAVGGAEAVGDPEAGRETDAAGGTDPVSVADAVGEAVGETDAVREEESATPARRSLGDRIRPAALAVPLGYLLASLLLYVHLWADLDRRYLVDSMRDQNQWEWFFAVTAHNVLNFDNPLFSTQQNFPLGVNLMANTVMLGLSVPLAPVTALIGATATWATVLTGGLAATATAWYWLIRKHLTRSRAAAVLGGAFSAFAPPMISHANAHPNLVALFAIPLIIDRVLRLCEGRRTVRDGIVLGLLLTWQIFLGEESLLLAATGLLFFGVAYGCLRPAWARTAVLPLIRGLMVGAAVCLPLVAYPLYWQFFGDQSYHSILHGPTGNPPLSLVEFSGRALAGDKETAAALSINPTEQNAFYGWPLVSLLMGIAVVLWGKATVRALTATAAFAALLSLGAWIPLPFTDTEAPGPWWVFDKLPLFESVIESRYAMVCAPAIGMLLALAWTSVAESAAAVPEMDSEQDRRSRALVIRVACGLALAAALLPITPKPLETVDRPDVPTLVAGGNWRSYVQPGQSLVPVPLPSPGEASALKWQIDADFGFPLPGGYFNGPAGPDRVGTYGAVPRPTNDLLTGVRYSGRIPVIGPDQRRAAREDLRFWRAGALVLASQPNDEALRITVQRLLGSPGERVGDSWVWNVG